ncbi:RHS repeat-associated core domain-containing protein [Streptomyces sp. NPDC049881]|uniref:RHS repeat-associated core domain-containing protein n=1 Tax=Streptomyces sp. NPDC049881 TaxID=3155778 RepID=UPI00343B86D2
MATLVFRGGRERQGGAIRRLTWDGHLIGLRLSRLVTPDGTVWRYAYDPFGRRVAKERLAGPADAVAETVLFAWDGHLLVEETVTHGGGGGHHVSLTWEHQGLQPVAQVERVTEETTQREIDVRFFAVVTDAVGTPTELVGAAGEVAWQARSTLWGVTSWRRGATAYTPLRFPGQYFDRESGLHYNLHRYYAPVAGRYSSPDPLGLGPSPNPMSYVSNPHTWADPLGLTPGCGDLGDDWVPLDINNPANWNGCEDVAVAIQQRLGGGTRYRISNAIPHPLAENFAMGPYRGAEPGWFHHDVLVHQDRVYDGFTGRHGLSRDEYNALWSPDYLDILHWRPLD